MAKCNCNNSGSCNSCGDDTYTTTNILRGSCVDGLMMKKPDCC